MPNSETATITLAAEVVAARTASPAPWSRKTAGAS
jgi:hypothetical protein